MLNTNRVRQLTTWGAGVAGFSAACIAFAHNPAFTITSTAAPLPGFTGTKAFAVNNYGLVVGVAESFNGNTFPMIWSSGGHQTYLSQPGGARSVNDAGNIAGWIDLSGGIRHAAFWRNDLLNDLGTLGGPDSDALAVNESGIVVGWAQTASGNRHAFAWSNGHISDLGTLGGAASEATAVNAAGQIVGWADTPSGSTHAFIYENGAMRDLGTLGGPNSTATGVNEFGEVTGSSDTSSGSVHTFLLWNGAMQDLGTLGGDQSRGTAVNHNHIVGFSFLPNGETSQAYYWEKGMQRNMNLNAMIPSGSIWDHFSEATAINQRQQIVGWGYLDNGAIRAFMLTPSLNVTDPVPGIAGQVNHLDAAGAMSGERILFAYGFQNGATSIPGCSGVTVNISNPRLIGSALADVHGNARLDFFVPESARGRSVLFEAIERSSCRTSIVLGYTFQ